MILINYFFITLSRSHLDQHSFPTRRSSDLQPAFAHHPQERHAVGLMHRAEQVVREAGDEHGLAGAAQAGDSERRSEEHTSELQSQFHLVCRLLLEKKKKNESYVFIM